jgi:hypothetical protein
MLFVIWEVNGMLGRNVGKSLMIRAKKLIN